MHVASPSCKLALYGKRLATVNYNKITYLDDTLGVPWGRGGGRLHVCIRRAC